jgi:hypothetical protein
MNRLRTIVAAGVATATLAGCGDREATYENIVVPESAVDLGQGMVEVGRYGYPGHSFKVQSKLVGKVSCGAITVTTEYNDKTRRILMDKKITPAGDNYSQVDCVFDEGAYLSYDEIKNMVNLPVVRQ